MRVIRSCLQDGRIAEAVAWQLPPAQRHAVLDHVMQYAMGKHLRQYTEDGKVDVHGSSELLDAALTSRLSSLELQAASTRCAGLHCAASCIVCGMQNITALCIL